MRLLGLTLGGGCFCRRFHLSGIGIRSLVKLAAQSRALVEGTVVARFSAVFAAILGARFLAALGAEEFAWGFFHSLAAQFRAFVERAVLAGCVFRVALVIRDVTGDAVSAVATVSGEAYRRGLALRCRSGCIARDVGAAAAASQRECQQGTASNPGSHLLISREVSMWGGVLSRMHESFEWHQVARCAKSRTPSIVPLDAAGGHDATPVPWARAAVET